MQKTTPRDFDFEKTEPSYWAQQAWWMGPLAVFVLTVALTVMSFPPFNAAPFGYVFAAPAVFWALTKPRFKKFALVMLAAQMVSWIVILWWLHHVTWGGLFLLGSFIGIWVGLWYPALWWAARRVAGRPVLVRVAVMLGLAGLWVVNEWLRTWLLSGFPWLPLGASQWRVTPLLQIASFTGQGGIAFVLVLFNFGFAAYFHRLFREKHTGLRKRSPEFVVALLVLLVAVMPLLPDLVDHSDVENTESFIRVALVQPDIPQSVKWSKENFDLSFNVLRDLTARAKFTQTAPALNPTTGQMESNFPEVIIWPETAIPYAMKGWPNSEGVQKWVVEMAGKVERPILTGAVACEDTAHADDTFYNEAFVVYPKNEKTGEQGRVILDAYQKRHLVPFGEYVPMRSLLGWLQKVSDVSDGDTQAGKLARSLLIKTDRTMVSAGMLICYEDIFPDLAVSNVYGGAEVHVVITNNAWFGEGAAAYQHAAHSVLRAVETRRPVIRCGNSGWSGWIDEYGNIRGVMTNDAGTIYYRGTQTFDIKRDTRWAGCRSFYVEHGDWFVLVSGVLVFFSYAMAQFYKPRDKAPPTYAEVVAK